MPKDLLDPEILKTQDKLTEEQEEALQEATFKKLSAEEEESGEDEDEEEEDEDLSGGKPPKKKDTADDEEEDEESEEESEEEEEESEAEKQKKAEQEAAEKQKRLEEAKKKPEADLSDDEKNLIKEAKEAEIKAKEEEFQKDVEEYATEFGISEEQAKKDVEKIYNAREKYKNNPKEMAKALYHLNVKLSQAQMKLSSMEASPVPKQLKVDGKLLSEEETKQFMITKYREAYVDVTEGLDDEKVYKLALKEIEERARLFREKTQRESKEKAEAKRREVIEKLPEEDKRFAKEIRGTLMRVDDSEILSEDFDINDYIYWARGKNYHKDLKEAVAKAKEEALKDKKILGKKAENTSGGGSGAKDKKKSVKLSEQEKEEALGMYESLDVPDEKKFEMYLDVKKSAA